MKHIIYQVLTRLWGRGKFSDWDTPAFEYLHTLGVDYIWFTGIPRHALGEAFVKGEPGSPYAIEDWKDVNPYLADQPDLRMQEFDALVIRTHRAGFKILIDYIPNHVARNYKGGICHYDYCDSDWTDTLKNDWSSPQTRAAMLDILRFWASKGVDGFRCDMAELVPSEALAELLKVVKTKFPDIIFIGEVYGKDKYRTYLEDIGFDLLYDKSGLYDDLRSICRNGSSARAITWNWQRLWDMQPRMLNFLENHDEQRIASPAFLGSGAVAIPALAVSLLFNTASFMLYFGQEVGEDASESQDGRTSIFNWTKALKVAGLVRHIEEGEDLEPEAASLLARYKSLLRYAKIPAFSSGNCWDLCYCNGSSVGFNAERHFAFVRFDYQEAYLVFSNFSDSPASVDVSIPEDIQTFCRCDSKSIVVGARDAAIVKL